MLIKVIIKGALKNYVSDDQFTLNLDGNIQIKKLEKILKLPIEIPKFISVNGKKALPDYVVKDNDEVVFVSAVGGG